MPPRQRDGFAGRVIELLPSALVRVELDGKHQVLAHPAGGIHRNFIRVLAGDRVLVELSEHDPTRGRIVAKL